MRGFGIETCGRFSLPEDEVDERFDLSDVDTATGGSTIGCAEIGGAIEGRGGRRDFSRCRGCNVKVFAPDEACARCGGDTYAAVAK